MGKLTGILFFAIILSMPAKATSTKIYVWRNENGVLVFSDSPRPGAEEIQVKENDNVLPSVNTKTLDINPNIVTEKFELEITQPEHEATIRDNTGSVYISGRIMPRFKRGFKVQLYIDDQPFESPSTQSIFILRDLDRGEHTIKMTLIDETGKVIATSPSKVFFMHRASVYKAK